MLENGFLSTGDLVKILGTTKNTLFHYDSMGLFSPAMVKENGYRAYSYRQMETFRAISSLRQLGMSLSEIKDYMQNRNPERLNQLLHTQLLGIQEEIKKLRQIEKFLHHHIQSLAELKALDLDSITIEEQPEQTLYCSLPVNVEDEKSTLCHLGKFFSESIYFKTLGAILSTEDILQGNYCRYRCFFCPVDQKEESLERLETKPKGRYLVGYHHGDYSSISKTYLRMLEFAQKNQLSLGNLGYEEYLMDELYVIEENEYITRILFALQ